MTRPIQRTCSLQRASQHFLYGTATDGSGCATGWARSTSAFSSAALEQLAQTATMGGMHTLSWHEGAQQSVNGFGLLVGAEATASSPLLLMTDEGTAAMGVCGWTTWIFSMRLSAHMRHTATHGSTPVSSFENSRQRPH